MTLAAALEGRVNLKSTHMEIQTSLGLDQGEVLFDRYYMDLTRNPFFFTVKAECDLHEKSFTASSFSAGFRDIVKMAGQCGGSLEPRKHYEISFSIPETPLKPLFQQPGFKSVSFKPPEVERLLLFKDGGFLMEPDAQASAEQESHGMPEEPA